MNFNLTAGSRKRPVCGTRGVPYRVVCGGSPCFKGSVRYPSKYPGSACADLRGSCISYHGGKLAGELHSAFTGTVFEKQDYDVEILLDIDRELMRLCPAKDSKSGVPDLQSIFYTTPFLAELYGYVKSIYKNTNITTPCRKGERAHPKYNVEVLRDTFLAAFVTKDAVCPGF